MKKYSPGAIEKKWQKKWEKEGVYRQYGREKSMYVLDMFPYPSGAALHVGHPKGYIATDVLARMKQLQGYGVLHPMGWDAFGLPAEQHAIKNKVHPEKSVKENIERFKKQLQSIGFTYDWEREITTTDPEYYKWTQWIFLQLFKKGLAYQSFEPINWCPSCQTGLANEDLENGRCERCGSVVEKKPMRQWVLRMTDYADRLLADLDPPAGGEKLRWPESIKEQQRNWIGRSEGAVVDFLVPKFKEILLATTSEGKRDRVERFLRAQGLDIKVHTIKSLGLTEKVVPEEGELRENALAKALAYREATDLPIMATDAGFFIEGEDLDPTRPKRNALEGKDEKEFSQKEIAEKMKIYYQNIARKRGGKVGAYWIDEFVLLQPDDTVLSSQSRREVVLTDQIFGKFNEYLPVRALYIAKATGKPANLHTPEEEWREMQPMIQAVTELVVESLKIFTTRLDTIYGATYVVVAPEHELLQNQKSKIKNQKEVEQYLKQVVQKTELERTDLAKEKTGVKLEGVNAVNPFTKESVPIFVADYVLGSYGTGAIMAVPAHDERDFEFAKKYDLPIKTVIERAIKGKKYLLLHGFTGSPESNFLPWLKEELEKRGASVEVPMLPNTDKPAVEEQEEFILKNCSLDEKTTIIGHSLGVAVGLKVVEALNHPIAGFVSLAGFLKSKFLDHERPFTKVWPNFDVKKILANIREFTILRDLHDDAVPAERAEELRKAFGGRLVDFIAEESHICGKQEPKVLEALLLEECLTEDGAAVHSGEFSGLPSAEAREKMSQWLEKNGLGEKKVNYRMRDWVFSRQRYWGEPIPIIHCEKCGVVPVPEEDLPVELPHVKSYEPTGTGESPLANIDSWVNVKCPKCGGAAKRETNTMPQWAGSSWYYLRFIDPKNEKALVDPEKEKKMMPVDVYVGGTEHATRHLLYARFWHKFLFDMGVVSTQEPFTRLVNQGLILASDGRKMSKRWGNVINPDEMVAEFGADAFRLYEMFMGPFGQAIAWNTNGVVGMRRFLEKVWRLNSKISFESEPGSSSLRVEDKNQKSKIQFKNQNLETLLHRTIKKVTEDIEDFKFNTAVSSLMILVNAFEREEKLEAKSYKLLLLLLSPFAPHLAEELWMGTGEKKSVFLALWPSYDERLIQEGTREIVIQVNGKVRDRFLAETQASSADLEKMALDQPKVKELLKEKTVRKVIVVPGKVVNVVI